MITLKLLEELDACDPGVEYFKHEHGEAATLEEVLSNPRLDHNDAAWLGWYLPADYMTWEERLALQLDDEDRALLSRYCPAGVEGATWEARIAVQLVDKGRALLGRICPACVEGSTWKARLAVQCDDRERAWLGRICPPDVEGSTWKARLAVQRDYVDRALLGRNCPAGVEGATLEARLAVQVTDWSRNYVLKKFGGEHDTHDNA
jgi:hypothetical protein